MEVKGEGTRGGLLFCRSILIDSLCFDRATINGTIDGSRLISFVNNIYFYKNVERSSSDLDDDPSVSLLRWTMTLSKLRHQP